MDKPVIGRDARSILNGAHHIKVVEAGRGVYDHGKAREVELNRVEWLCIIANHGSKGAHIADKARIRKNSARDDLLILMTPIRVLNMDVSTEALGDDDIVFTGVCIVAHDANNEFRRGSRHLDRCCCADLGARRAAQFCRRGRAG